MKDPVTLVRSIRQRLIAHFEKNEPDSCFMRRSQDVSGH